MVEALLQDSRLSWLQQGGADSDVVLASRILLSRNLRDLPFPNRADLYELAKVEDETFSWLCRGLSRQQIDSLLQSIDLMLQNAWEDKQQGGEGDCD